MFFNMLISLANLVIGLGKNAVVENLSQNCQENSTCHSEHSEECKLDWNRVEECKLDWNRVEENIKMSRHYSRT